MNFILENKIKINQFLIIFQLIKGFSEMVTLQFNEYELMIQTMDKAHVCLCEVHLLYNWFDNLPEIANDNVTLKYTLNTVMFYNILRFLEENQVLEIGFINESFCSILFRKHIEKQIEEEVIEIPVEPKVIKKQIKKKKTKTNAESKTEAEAEAETKTESEFKAETKTKTKNTKNKLNNLQVSKTSNISYSFELPLIEMEQELMDVQPTDYQVEFTVKSKLINDIFNRVVEFSNSIQMVFTEENALFKTVGENGNIQVNLSTGDFEEYSIDEGATIHIEFSSMHIQKLCITSKLSETVGFSIHTEKAMKIFYPIEIPESYLAFYIAPKLTDY